jgi:proteasome lid subunit RPN8/RPN11
MFLLLDPALRTAPLDRELLAAVTQKYRGILATLDGPLIPDDPDPHDLSVPPVPYDRLPVLKITADAHEAMTTYLARHEPEVAGAMLAVKGDEIVTRFVADEWGRATCASFTFGTAELNRVLRPHIDRGEEIVGIAHSHPAGITRPSGGDLAYFQGVFDNPKNVELREFWCPIFANGTLHVYLARRHEPRGTVRFLNARLEVVPAKSSKNNCHSIRSLDTTRIQKLIDVEKMNRSTVTLVGTGGGANLARNLVRCNLGRINLVDFDRVEAVNVCRQEHFADAIGTLKVETLATELRRINPAAEVRTVPRNFCTFTDAEIADRFGDTDLFVFAVDNLAANARGNEVALRLKKPAVWSGLYSGGRAGEIAFWTPGRPCYRCLCNKRYEARDRGDDVSQPAESADIFAVQYLDSVGGMIALGLLTAGADNGYGRLIEQLGDRNFVQLKISPEWTFGGRDIFRDHLGIADDCPTYFNWLALARRDPTGGHPPCPDCQSILGRI